MELIFTLLIAFIGFVYIARRDVVKATRIKRKVIRRSAPDRVSEA
jgi:hypothetical protein